MSSDGSFGPNPTDVGGLEHQADQLVQAATEYDRLSTDFAATVQRAETTVEDMLSGRATVTAQGTAASIVALRRASLLAAGVFREFAAVVVTYNRGVDRLSTCPA